MAKKTRYRMYLEKMIKPKKESERKSVLGKLKKNKK